MEFRAQESDNQMMRSTTSAAGSLSCTHLPKDQSPGSGAATTDRRKSLNANISSTTSHNGNSTTGLTSNCTTQTLENICPRPCQTRPAQLHVQQQPLKDLEHNSPDPTPFSPLSAVMKSKTTSSAAVKYRECLKNHAASVGGSVFDGCGEFMPSGQEGSLEALKCAACQCHRNFHRKEVDGESSQLYSPGSRRSSIATTTTALMLNPLQLTPPLPSPSLHHHHPNQHHHHGHHHHHHHQPPHHKYPIVQPMNVAYGGATAGTESSSEDLNVYGQSTAEVGVPPPPFALSKKRFRTKFTQEQKDRMLEFAEKVGWRIQKQDEEEVERFCSEVGVKRQVLKVWMHNNKSAVKKQQENMMMTTANNDSTAGNIHDNMQSLEVSEVAEDEALDT